MRHVLTALSLVTAFIATGCSTSQQVLLAKPSSQPIATVAHAPQDGNSKAMDEYLDAALARNGIAVRSRAEPGARTARGVDAVVNYDDVWRWDVLMYLRSLSIKMYDAHSGDLLAVGEWKESTMHGFRDARTVVQNLVDEMLQKMRNGER